MPSCLLGSRDVGLPSTSGLSRRGSCSACLASQPPRQIARHAWTLVKGHLDHCAQPHHRASVAARFFAQVFGLDPSASARAVRQQLGIYRGAPDTCSSRGLHAWYAPLHRCSHRRSSSSMLSVQSDEVRPETNGIQKTSIQNPMPPRRNPLSAFEQ